MKQQTQMMYNKNETVYKQQLKNAVRQNSRTPIRQCVEKHMIQFPRTGLQKNVNFAIYAEKVCSQKKKKMM